MERIILLFSSTDGREKNLLNELSSIYFKLGHMIKSNENDIPKSFDFSIVDPEKNASYIFQKILRLFSEPDKYKITVACHNNQCIGPVVTQILNEANNKVIIPINFSHEPRYKIWSEGFKPYLDAIIKNIASGKIEAIYDKLWKMLVPSPAEEARVLRAKILYPLVALDWLEQMNETLNSAVENELYAIKASKPDLIRDLEDKFDNLDEQNKKLVRTSQPYSVPDRR